MRRRAPLLALAVILAIPPLRFVLSDRTPQVDRSSAEWKAREALITRARVFDPRHTQLTASDLDQTIGEVSCRFVPKASTGTTAKFDCRLDNGAVVKVKYGWSPERYAEVAATRLLLMLGFGADRMSMAERVRCYGCPRWPFETRVLAEQFFLEPVFERAIDYDRSREFTWTAVEHKIDGREIEVDDFEGWDWRELSLVDASKGGATSAEIDALRLMAVFLAYWDNKASNQRLLCVDDTCQTPLLIMQDLGATFGPSKVKHANWSELPVWKDAPTCTISMETLPYKGILFPPVQISEAGRALLASKLTLLSEAEILALFRGARFPDPQTGDVPARDLMPWVRTFQQKVHEIVDRPPCPSLT